MDVDILPSVECITVTAPDSQDTSVGSDGNYRYSFKDSGYHSSFEAGYRSSVDSTTHSPSLRGGATKKKRPPPKTARKPPPTVPPVLRTDGVDVDIDYKDLEAVIDDDGYSTSSDWDNYGSLPLTTAEYNLHIAGLEGSDDWNEDQRKLYRLNYMRGLHPMLPSWWRIGFKMWGVTQPHLDDVFTPKFSKKRVAIHAYGNEMAGEQINHFWHPAPEN